MSKFRTSRPFSAQERDKVRFDDLGNAVYDWHDELLYLEGPLGDRLRANALDNPTLALVDDEDDDDPRKPNKRGARLGYNPYNSGQLPTQPSRRRVDLRELSKWIEQQRRGKSS